MKSDIIIAAGEDLSKIEFDVNSLLPYAGLAVGQKTLLYISEDYFDLSTKVNFIKVKQ